MLDVRIGMLTRGLVQSSERGHALCKVRATRWLCASVCVWLCFDLRVRGRALAIGCARQDADWMDGVLADAELSGTSKVSERVGSVMARSLPQYCILALWAFLWAHFGLSLTRSAVSACTRPGAASRFNCATAETLSIVVGLATAVWFREVSVHRSPRIACLYPEDS